MMCTIQIFPILETLDMEDRLHMIVLDGISQMIMKLTSDYSMFSEIEIHGLLVNGTQVMIAFQNSGESLTLLTDKYAIPLRH